MRGGALWGVREARPEPLDAAYRALLARDDVVVAVGTVDDVVVGFGVVELERLRDSSMLGRIEELYVEPETRGIGVGETLARAIVGFCDEHGCVGVDALALPGHREAKSFFEAAGFSARAIVMHRSQPHR